MKLILLHFIVLFRHSTHFSGARDILIRIPRCRIQYLSAVAFIYTINAVLRYTSTVNLQHFAHCKYQFRHICETHQRCMLKADAYYRFPQHSHEAFMHALKKKSVMLSVNISICSHSTQGSCPVSEWPFHVSVTAVNSSDLPSHTHITTSLRFNVVHKVVQQIQNTGWEEGDASYEGTAAGRCSEPNDRCVMSTTYTVLRQGQKLHRMKVLVNEINVNRNLLDCQCQL
ncbi:hypothetical protein F2P81_004700 [Scophthalmus maximus]|uniref:Uncharacterized protein n=1 Tax=Scophthalmus maximus TaxID=52904 RepID=A0A6A4TBI4_SCOMX|nr:hypothetical protein F2P81_004700 [Scophthalmus maximus]